MVEQLAVKHKLPLSLEYNANLGYHINVAIPQNASMIISDLPAEFIQVLYRSTSFMEFNFHCISNVLFMRRREKTGDPSR